MTKDNVKKNETKKFEYPQMTILHRSVREVAYGPENPYHCTYNSCCYDGK